MLQSRCADGTRIQARMRMVCARGKMVAKTREVERNVACGVEPDFMTGYMQVRRLRDGVAYGLAQAEEGLTQIVARGLLRFIWPEESKQCFAAMRTVGFDSQVQKGGRGSCPIQIGQWIRRSR